MCPSPTAASDFYPNTEAGLSVHRTFTEYLALAMFVPTVRPRVLWLPEDVMPVNELNNHRFQKMEKLPVVLVSITRAQRHSWLRQQQ